MVTADSQTVRDVYSYLRIKSRVSSQFLGVRDVYCDEFRPGYQQRRLVFVIIYIKWQLFHFLFACQFCHEVTDLIHLLLFFSGKDIIQ